MILTLIVAILGGAAVARMFWLFRTMTPENRPQTLRKVAWLFLFAFTLPFFVILLEKYGIVS